MLNRFALCQQPAKATKATTANKKYFSTRTGARSPREDSLDSVVASNAQTNELHVTRQDTVVGFIGLGEMGSRMAANLLKDGVRVIGYDLDVKRMQAFKEKGGHVASALTDFSDTTVILTCLPSQRAVESTYFGEKGLLSAKGTKPRIILDCSTMSPTTARQISAKAAERDIVLDAPISGGVQGAQAGTLTFMIGGEKEVVDKVETILHCMGDNIIYCGHSGMGQTAKICNNLAACVNNQAACEAYILAEKLGVQPTAMTEIFNSSSGRSFFTTDYNPIPGIVEGAPSSKGYEGGGSISIGRKDLQLALDTAQQEGIPTMLGACAQQIMKLMEHRGYGENDFTFLYQFLKQGKK